MSVCPAIDFLLFDAPPACPVNGAHQKSCDHICHYVRHHARVHPCADATYGVFHGPRKRARNDAKGSEIIVRLKAAARGETRLGLRPLLRFPAPTKTWTIHLLQIRKVLLACDTSCRRNL